MGIDADITHLERLWGDIDIMEMWGAGTTICIRGPAPNTDAAWGAVELTGDLSSITFITREGNINISEDAELILPGLSLISSGHIRSEGTFIINGTLEVISGEEFVSSGHLEAMKLIQRGAECYLSGTIIVGHASYDNLDGALTELSGNISGVHEDTGNINITGVITLIGHTELRADSNGTQVGKIDIDEWTINGGGYNLTLSTGEDVLLNGDIVDVGVLELSSSTANDKTYTSTGTNFSVHTLKTNYHAKFTRDETDGSVRLIFSVSDLLGGLQYINEDLSGEYRLANNIDASETADWNSGEGFLPVGDDLDHFSGDLDGDGYVIDALFIDRPSSDHVGLFGYTRYTDENRRPQIKNMGLTNVDITGRDYVGGIAGRLYVSRIDDSFVTGSLQGNDNVGGMVGASGRYSFIFDSWSDGIVMGSDYVGGLVGKHYQDSQLRDSYSKSTVQGVNNVGGLTGQHYSACEISDSYATGDVTGEDQVGGLIGKNYRGHVESSYATGNVTGNDYVGGLAGLSGYHVGTYNAYATGNVTGNNYVGGLIGHYGDYSPLVDSYATGDVVGTGSSIGGLVGGTDKAAEITRCYATGSVTGGERVGGLVGRNYRWDSLIEDSYSTGSVTGDKYVGGLVGLNREGVIERSYSTGEVVCNIEYGGGIVGYNWSDSVVRHSYFAGSLSGGGIYFGGAVGYDAENNIDNFVNLWWSDLQDRGVGNDSVTYYGHFQINWLIRK